MIPGVPWSIVLADRWFVNLLHGVAFVFVEAINR